MCPLPTDRGNSPAPGQRRKKRGKRQNKNSAQKQNGEPENHAKPSGAAAAANPEPATKKQQGGAKPAPPGKGAPETVADSKQEHDDLAVGNSDSDESSAVEATKPDNSSSASPADPGAAEASTAKSGTVLGSTLTLVDDRERRTDSDWSDADSDYSHSASSSAGSSFLQLSQSTFCQFVFEIKTSWMPTPQGELASSPQAISYQRYTYNPSLERFSVFVHAPGQRPMCALVSGKTTVPELKKKACEIMKHRVPLALISLSYQNKILRNDCSLSTYHIGPDSAIRVHIRPKASAVRRRSEDHIHTGTSPLMSATSPGGVSGGGGGSGVPGQDPLDPDRQLSDSEEPPVVTVVTSVRGGARNPEIGQRAANGATGNGNGGGSGGGGGGGGDKAPSPEPKPRSQSGQSNASSTRSTTSEDRAARAAKLHEYEQTIASLKRTIKDMRADHQNEVSRKTQEAKKLKEQVQKLEQEAAKLRSVVSEANKQVLVVVEEAKEKDKVLKEKDKQLQTYKRKVENFESSHQASNTKQKELQEQVKSLTAEIESLKTSHQRRESENKQRQRELVEDVARSFDEKEKKLSARISDLENSLRSQRESSEKKEKDLLGKLSEQENQTKAQAGRASRLEAELKKAREETVQVSTDLQAALNQVKSLQVETQRLESERTLNAGCYFTSDSPFWQPPPPAFERPATAALYQMFRGVGGSSSPPPFSIDDQHQRQTRTVGLSPTMDGLAASKASLLDSFCSFKSERLRSFSFEELGLLETSLFGILYKVKERRDIIYQDLVLATALQEKTFVEQSANLCVICAERKACMVNVPCGHCALCESCQAPDKLCPLCRNKVSKKIRAFFP